MFSADFYANFLEFGIYQGFTTSAGGKPYKILELLAETLLI
jgi:hypothetical protein